MTIDEAVDLLEFEYVEEDIRKLQPKDRLAFWANLKEFQRAKLQRATHEPNAGDVEAIIISYED